MVTSGHGVIAEDSAPAPRLVPATPADLPLLLRYVEAYYAEDGHGFDAPRQGRALALLLAGGPLGRVWLIEIEGAVRGYLVLALSLSLEAGGIDGVVDELWLEPASRGRGVGLQVLRQLDEAARALGVVRLYLEVVHGNPAQRLYRRAGFTDNARHFMSKWLDRRDG